jgi:hypothetical protein
MWDIRCWTVGLKVINMKYFVDLDPVPEDDQRNWTQVLLPPPQCVSRSCCDQLRTEVTLHAGSKAIPFRHVRKDFRGLSLERWSHLACILFWVINGPFSWANYIYIYIDVEKCSGSPSSFSGCSHLLWFFVAGLLLPRTTGKSHLFLGRRWPFGWRAAEVT